MAISWLFECSVNEGKLDELKGLLADLTSKAKSDEPGTVIYEQWLNADNSEFHFFERFADSEAALAHLGNFGPRGKQFMSCCTPTRVFVYGEPNDQLRGALADFGPAYFTLSGGFSR